MRALIILMMMMTPAAAQPLCAPYHLQAKHLSTKWQEVPVFTGRLGRQVTIRLFANPTTGTWTLLFVRAQTSCVRAAGRDAKLHRGNSHE